MRISTQLLTNAVSTYGRLGTTFVLGIFFTWYVIGQVGLVGFGTMSLAAGTFGVAAAFIYSVRLSVVRELAAALASGSRERIERTLASALAFTGMVAVFVLLIFGGLALLALLGVFRTPEDEPGLKAVLAALFAAEGVITATYLLLTPVTMTLFASQRVWADNLLTVVRRIVAPLSAVLAFSVLEPDGSLTEKLLAFTLLRGGLGVLEVLLEAGTARLLVPNVRIRLRAFDRAEFRTVSSTSWQALQFTLASDLNPHLLMLVINLLFGLAYNGLWQIVIQIGGHARMVAGGALHGIDPLAAKLHEEGRTAAIGTLTGRVVRYQLMVVFPFVCFYLVFLPPIVQLWVGDRLARNPDLAAVGITVAQALHMLVIMGSINLLAELFRASTFGLERILYGMGRIRSYSWFAKWSVVINLTLGWLLMWSFNAPVLAPVPLALVQFIYCCVIVPVAAVKHTGVSIGTFVRVALPRPVIMGVLLTIPVAFARTRIETLTLSGLVGVCLLVAVVYAPLALFIGLDSSERGRLRELLAGARRRLG